MENNNQTTNATTAPAPEQVMTSPTTAANATHTVTPSANTAQPLPRKRSAGTTLLGGIVAWFIDDFVLAIATFILAFIAIFVFTSGYGILPSAYENLPNTMAMLVEAGDITLITTVIVVGTVPPALYFLVFGLWLKKRTPGLLSYDKIVGNNSPNLANVRRTKYYLVMFLLLITATLPRELLNAAVDIITRKNLQEYLGATTYTVSNASIDTFSFFREDDFIAARMATSPSVALNDEGLIVLAVRTNNDFDIILNSQEIYDPSLVDCDELRQRGVPQKIFDEFIDLYDSYDGVDETYASCGLD